MTVWDAPNQQVVRADSSGPAEEGSGGEPGLEPEEEPVVEAEEADEEE